MLSASCGPGCWESSWWSFLSRGYSGLHSPVGGGAGVLSLVDCCWRRRCRMKRMVQIMMTRRRMAPTQPPTMAASGEGAGVGGGFERGDVVLIEGIAMMCSGTGEISLREVEL